MTPSAFGIDVLSRVLDTAALRHRVIAQNVANVNTPGYRRLEVTFEDELAKDWPRPAGRRPKPTSGRGATARSGWTGTPWTSTARWAT